MDVVVLVPRRPDPWRDKLWRLVASELDRSGADWPIHEGLSIEGRFNRSAAINEAAAAAGAWDVAVILDADTVPEVDQVTAAIDIAARGQLAMAHDLFRSLSSRGTRRVLAGRCSPAAAQQRWDLANTYSSCLCVGRELWETVGGFDERFEGWGYEDVGFYMTCEALAGVERVKGPVHHLWHPRSSEKRPEDPQYRANRALSKQYRALRGDGEGMRRFLAEAEAPAAAR